MGNAPASRLEIQQAVKQMLALLADVLTQGKAETGKLGLKAAPRELSAFAAARYWQPAAQCRRLSCHYFCGRAGEAARSSIPLE